MNEYLTVAKNILLNNIFLKKQESIAIITDDSLQSIGEIFYETSVPLAEEALLLKMKTREKSGEEPPKQVAEAMFMSDVAICITEHSLTHTKARKRASENGTRVITMPGISLDMFNKGAITADYSDVETLTNEYCDILQSGEHVTIEKDGHALSLSIKGRTAIASTGVFRQAGDSGNLPSGESFIAPLETEANGKIVVDGAISGIGVLTEPTTLTIENGRLVAATGDAGRELLNILGDGLGRTIAEFGIGTNKSARLTGNVLEDEKVYGTIHIAFGSNKSFGGQTDAGVHIDCVVKHPRVTIDSHLLF